MNDSALSHVALSYQPIWGPDRAMAAVLLDVRPVASHALDGTHLCAMLRELWPEQAPRLLLQVHSVPLLVDLLTHPVAVPGALVVEDEAMADPAVHDLLSRARMFLPLVRRCELGAPSPGGPFSQEIVRLSVNQSLALLGKERLAAPRRGPPPEPPEVARFYEHVASERLAAWCLDREQAAGIVGWPAEEAAHRLWKTPMPPDGRLIDSLRRRIDEDASIETLEAWLGSDPVLSYRFLRFANSALLGLRTEIGSLRHGLMMVGAVHLREWLDEQLPHASGDANERPVRETSTLRSLLAEQLVDAGTEHELRRELHLCGLFSDLDILLGSKLQDLINPLPVAARIADAIVGHRGPYAGYLALARAMAEPAAACVASVCEDEGIDLEQANRGLLHMLSHLRLERQAVPA